jgi:transcriptional regulator with XRE-family HTH domain
MSESTSLTPTDEDAMSVANALIRARSELGLTQVQVAEASGVSRSAIKGYETGRNMPGGRELKALCSVLRVSPNAILFGTETPFSGGPEDGETPRWLRDASAEPESEDRARVRLSGLLSFLTSQERASILNLVQALAVARHGPEMPSFKIQQADHDVALMRAGLTVCQWAMRSTAPIDPAVVRKLFDEERARAETRGAT